MNNTKENMKCPHYPMCDHKNWLVGSVCRECPYRQSRLDEARRELQVAKRRVAFLTAALASEQPAAGGTTHETE
jgi:hypothetical protein